MAFSDIYRKQVSLLVRTLPHVAEEPCFAGMTDEPVSLDELSAAREALITGMVGKMPDAHRRFLVSFEKGQPDWELLGVPTAADLPAVKWRQQNLDTLSKAQRATLVENLERVLSDVVRD